MLLMQSTNMASTIDKNFMQSTGNLRSSSRTSNKKNENEAAEDAEAKKTRWTEAMVRAQKVANLSPLRFTHRSPLPQFTTHLDKEEREIIAKGPKMTKEQIWELLERKRFQELQKAAINLTSELLVYRRCPKCTLVPPCAHYETPDKITQEAPRIMASPSFKDILSPQKRNNLLKMVKSQNAGGNPDDMIGQNSNTLLYAQHPDNSYYIDTLNNAVSMDDENEPTILNIKGGRMRNH